MHTQVSVGLLTPVPPYPCENHHKSAWPHLQLELLPELCDLLGVLQLQLPDAILVVQLLQGRLGSFMM